MILLFYKKNCIMSLINKCDILTSFICWSERKLIANINQNIYLIIVLKYTVVKIWRYFVEQIFYVFVNFINDSDLPFMSTHLSIPYFLHHVSIQSLRLSIIADSVFFQWNIVDFLSSLIPIICNSPVTICRWSFLLL